MTDRTTGATAEQIDAASDRLIRDRMAENKVDGLDAQVRPITAIYASYLVPPTHRIVGPDDDRLSPATVEAVRRLQAVAQAAREWREAEAIEHPDLNGECRQLAAITDLIDAVDAITDADLALLGATP